MAWAALYSKSTATIVNMASLAHLLTFLPSDRPPDTLSDLEWVNFTLDDPSDSLFDDAF